MEMLASKSLLESVGTKIEEKDTIENIFHQTGLDWKVNQTNIDTRSIVYGTDNVLVNYRSDNNQFLGVVSGSHYKIINNVQAFSFIDELDNFEFDRAGCFKGGRHVFVVGKSTNQFEITPDDVVKQYLTFVHGHDGKHSIQLLITPIRMFCTNQLNLAMKTSTFKYSIKHSGDVETKLNKVYKALKENYHYMEELGNTLRKLTMRRSTITIDEFLERLFPTPDTTSMRRLNKHYERQDVIRDLYLNKDDNQNYKGCDYGFLNAVSDYVSHRKVKNRTSMAKENTFIETITDNKILDKAYKVLMAA